MESENEKTYTLGEARKIVAKEQCVAFGHDIDQIYTGADYLLKFFCQRCGATWSRDGEST